MEAVWRSLDAILDVLETLEGSKDGETKTKSANLLHSVRNIGFICGIMLLKNVMFKTKMLSDYLQGETVDVAGALVAISSTDGVLKSMRANDNEINNEIEAAIIVARNLGTEPLTDFSRLHRLRRPSRCLDDNPSTATPVLNDITLFYRCEFLKFIDSLISTLKEKSQSLTNVFQAFLKVIDPDTPGNLEDARKLVYFRKTPLPLCATNSKSSLNILMIKESKGNSLQMTSNHVESQKPPTSIYR